MGRAKSPLHGRSRWPLLEFHMPRISYTRAHEMATRAAFLNESRMNFINADRLNKEIRGLAWRWGVSSAQSAEWMETQLPSIAALVSKTAYDIAFQGVI